MDELAWLLLGIGLLLMIVVWWRKPHYLMVYGLLLDVIGGGFIASDGYEQLHDVYSRLPVMPWKRIEEGVRAIEAAAHDHIAVRKGDESFDDLIYVMRRFNGRVPIPAPVHGTPVGPPHSPEQPKSRLRLEKPGAAIIVREDIWSANARDMARPLRVAALVVQHVEATSSGRPEDYKIAAVPIFAGMESDLPGWVQQYRSAWFSDHGFIVIFVGFLSQFIGEVMRHHGDRVRRDRLRRYRLRRHQLTRPRFGRPPESC